MNANFYNAIGNSLLSAQSDHFQYTENTQALYFSLSKSFGKRWEAKTGLRGENTQTKANSISTDQITERNYFKLFPTAYLSYKASENSTFSINYGRRIERPGFSQLNSARWYNNPKSYVTGNPFIQPRFTDNIEINYGYKSILNINLFAGKTKDDITQVIRHDIVDDVQIFRHENYANSKFAGSTITTNYNPFKFWEASAEVTFYYYEVNPFVDIYAPKYSGWGGYTVLNNSITLNKAKTFIASINYTYNYPSLGVGTATENSSFDIGFRYLALEKKLSLGLNFEDVFRKNFTTYENNTSGILQNFTQYYDTRLLRISLSYKFGNKNISVNKREGGNLEEKRRSN